MSSFIMHIAISNKIKEELNLSDGFILGSILPDIYKLIVKNRELTHYETNIESKELPNIDKFINDFKDRNSDIFMGYLAHLIEDKIWFKEYVHKKYSNISVEDLYNDYAIIDKYIINKFNLDKTNIKSKILMQVNNIEYEDIDKKKVKKMINEKIIDYPITKNTVAFTNKDAEEYFDMAYKETKSIVEKLLNKNSRIK